MAKHLDAEMMGKYQRQDFEDYCEYLLWSEQCRTISEPEIAARSKADSQIAALKLELGYIAAMRTAFPELSEKYAEVLAQAESKLQA